MLNDQLVEYLLKQNESLNDTVANLNQTVAAQLN